MRFAPAAATVMKPIRFLSITGRHVLTLSAPIKLEHKCRAPGFNDRRMNFLNRFGTAGAGGLRIAPRELRKASFQLVSRYI